MALPEAVAEVLAKFDGMGGAGDDPPDFDAMRQQFEDIVKSALPLSGDADITPVDAGGAPAEWVVTPDSDPDRRLLYLHGGGYTIGSPRTVREMARRISEASGCSVLSLDYRMAPEHPFPAAIEDATAALRFIREHGPSGPSDAGAVFIAGDSAGGGLTLATLIATRDAGEQLPDAAVTLSAWTDLAATGESFDTRADVDPLVTDTDGLAGMAMMYLGAADPKTPLASPLYADFAGLPPLLMQVGDYEVLLSDTTRVAERARAAGVAVTEEIWPEMFHVWQIFAPMLPEGQQAIERIGEFLKTHVPATA